jgi:hypothetical protein
MNEINGTLVVVVLITYRKAVGVDGSVRNELKTKE